MYAFGAMLSFTIAHAAIVALRVKSPEEESVYRARPNLRIAGIDLPLFAIFGGLGTGAAWLVVVVQEESTRWVGLGWLAVGFAAYALYRRRFLHIDLLHTVRAPAIILGLDVSYRTILVPVLRTAESEEALVAAARLASERRSRIVILHVLEVPLDRTLDAEMADEEEVADAILDEAQALLEGYAGVQIVSRLERARSAGPAIVEEAARRNAEVVILGAARTKRRGGKPIFGRTVDYVLRNAPTRVAVVAGKQAA
jgi:APA family basic amino acid/polyamine antiporter